MSTGPPRVRVALAASPLVAVALLVTVALLGAAPVRAASCNSPSHQISLSSGSVNPGSGTAATSFTFSVVYRSNAGCAPTTVEVVIAGVGTFPMAGSGTHYEAGVTFGRTMTLPPGSHGYSFRAVAGSRSGVDTATLASVSPSTVTVVNPTATPVPATPPPTPRPPAPTASPTPVPTPTVTPSPSVSVSPSPPTSPSAATTPTFTPTPVHSLGGVVGPISSGGAPGAPGGTATGGEPSRPDGTTIFGRMAAEMPSLLIWLIATTGGLCLFMVLSRPAPQPESWPVTATGALPQQEPDHATVGALMVSQEGGEGRLPRWLRPSVQAARHAEPGRAPRRGDG